LRRRRLDGVRHEVEQRRFSLLDRSNSADPACSESDARNLGAAFDDARHLGHEDAEIDSAEARESSNGRENER